MCGFAAIAGFNDKGKERFGSIRECSVLLKHRGPDNQQFIIDGNFAMAHARLSIIDLSAASNQPFVSADGRFTMVFNGEVFNYKVLRDELKRKGQVFKSDGDVEVLLNLYREFGKDGLNKVNGFFAFFLYDKQTDTFFAARDRFGVKPFYYYADENYFACASELRSLKHITGANEIDRSALFAYLQLTYVPEKTTILKDLHKLGPGHCITIQNKKVKIEKYYSLQLPQQYAEVKNENKAFVELLESAIEARLVSDVPVGSFLSGGIDSSVITALASKQNKNLKTFSIGFGGNKHFDESVYAEVVAKKYHTDHHTFHLTEAEAEGELDNFFNSIDEPFADSSAFNVFILSQKTKQHVKVVLSGDGADELFAGYNKHRAEWMIRNQRAKTLLLKNSGAFSKLIPASRNSKLANKARQLQRFAAGAKLSAGERYWRWASFYDEKSAARIMNLGESERNNFNSLKNEYKKLISEDYNSVLLADMNLVLPGDMLVKVDRMSMAHGLEIRNPFLDYRMVEFAFSLKASSKIDGRSQKKIIKESCSHLLPAEILHRKKHGFETPVHQWLGGVLRAKIDELCLDKNFIQQQGLFDHNEIQSLVKKALSANAGDSTSVVWSLLIFNHWYKKHMI